VSGTGRPRTSGGAPSPLLLVVFDCDGVLVDSEIIASRVDAEHLTKLGYPITAEEVTQRFAGLTARELGAIVEAELGRPLPDDFYEEQKMEIDRRLARELEAVPGIHEVLDKLDGPRAVCSNSSSARLKLELEKTRLYDLFAPHIYSAVEVGDHQPKPSPNVYLHAMKQFGASPRESLVIEDSVFGVTAARLSGARVVGFTGGRHTWPGHADKLTEAGAETVIRRFADLPKMAEAFVAWEGLVD
jgi:HAD superfamily hydrolase (TIGR01509 family)